MDHENYEMWSFLLDFDFIEVVPIIEVVQQFPKPLPIMMVVVRVEVGQFNPRVE